MSGAIAATQSAGSGWRTAKACAARMNRSSSEADMSRRRMTAKDEAKDGQANILPASPATDALPDRLHRQTPTRILAVDRCLATAPRRTIAIVGSACRRPVREAEMITETDWVADVRRWCLANPKVAGAVPGSSTEAGAAGASKDGHEGVRTVPSPRPRTDASSYAATGLR